MTAHRMSGADRGAPGAGLPEGRPTGRGSRAPGARRAQRAGWAAGIAVVAVVLFLCYLRLSQRIPVGSDGGSIALQAWDMLHGNVLLRQWTVSDVSFYPTELVQYALIEALRGLGPNVVHIAGAMTYTVLLLLAAWLAKGSATGREGLIRALVAAVVMLAPAPGAGSTLLLSPDHFGSTVPVLLAWLTAEPLLADRAGRARWYVPPAVAIVLAWGQFADSLILVTGVAPMVIVCAARAGVTLWRRRAVRGTPRGWPWAEVSLAAAAVVSVGLARAASALIRLSGGFAVRPVPISFAGLAALPHNLKLTAEGLLVIFGADFTGPHSGPDLAFAALHLIVVAAVAVAFVIALGRLGRDDELAVPGLAIAIVLNVAAYVPTTLVQDLRSTREISAVLPFAAVLAGQRAGRPAAPGQAHRRARGDRSRLRRGTRLQRRPAPATGAEPVSRRLAGQPAPQRWPGGELLGGEQHDPGRRRPDRGPAGGDGQQVHRPALAPRAENRLVQPGEPIRRLLRRERREPRELRGRGGRCGAHLRAAGAGAAPGGLHRPGVAQEPAGRPPVVALGTPVA